MHNRGIVHRDLKLDNILIDQQGEVKLIDFGFATHCKKGHKLTMTCGTPQYMDPDLTKKNHYNGHAADNWALGVILFIMVTGRLPYFAAFEADLFRKIQNAKF
jgi:serine/threonine protein kinase